MCQIRTLTLSIDISGGVCGGVIMSAAAMAVLHCLVNGMEHSELMTFIREITANAAGWSAPKMG